MSINWEGSGKWCEVTWWMVAAAVSSLPSSCGMWQCTCERGCSSWLTASSASPPPPVVAWSQWNSSLHCSIHTITLLMMWTMTTKTPTGCFLMYFFYRSDILEVFSDTNESRTYSKGQSRIRILESVCRSKQTSTNLNVRRSILWL